MISSLRFIVDDSVSITYPTLYRSIVRALEYVTLTQFELSFSVNKVCPYMHKPQLTHWKAIKRILRYLADTATHGLCL